MSRPRIVIRAFTLRRDGALSILLEKELTRLGCSVIVASSRDFVRTMKYWNPNAVVVNTVGQVERSRELAPDAAVVMMPGEGGKR